jgi:hypothetical protein
MRHLKRISWAMTILGVLIFGIALLFDLDAMWVLSGILLAWAGIVKIVVTFIWTHVARMGTDDHMPTPSP